MKFQLPTTRSVVPQLNALRDFSLRILPYWVAAALTGIVSVGYSKIFGWSEQAALSWAVPHPAMAFVIMPVALIASAMLARIFAPYSAGSGIPQLIAAVEVSKSETSFLKKLIGPRVIVAKFIGSCVCVAGGGVTGREGPMLQIAAGLFNGVQKLWPKARAKFDTQSMILAGGAAGLASAFNTPLGGIIFAVEELAKVHISHVRTTIFHSVVIAGLLAQALLGNYLYLGKIGIEQSHLTSSLFLAIASALIGITGASFGLFAVKAYDWRAKLSANLKVVMTGVCGLIIASIFYFVGPEALGSGRHVIVNLLTHPNEHVGFELGFVRMFSSYFTYVGGVVGGIFAPALASGAAFGVWMSSFVPSANVQVWILGGMVAFLTGVTRTPFTSMILVLEMTDSHGIILDLMMAAVLAQGAARLIDPVSFYEHMAHRFIGQLSGSPSEGDSKADSSST